MDHYPDRVPCLHPGIVGRGGKRNHPPCDGTARRYEEPPMLLANDRGDWYGCPRCGCVAQYQDYLDHAEQEQLQ